MTPPVCEINSMLNDVYVGEETLLLPPSPIKHRKGDSTSSTVAHHGRPSVSVRWLCTVARDIAGVATLGMILYIASKHIRRPMHAAPLPDISVAFIGNSMMYYNDLPRFLELLSQHHLTQKSCLHGDASLSRILETGNGMYGKFNTSNSLDHTTDEYDFGACTVKQLLLGHDEELEREVWTNTNGSIRNDGTNPCFQDPNYLSFLDSHTFRDTPSYNFIILNDNTRNPGREVTRRAGLRVLQSHYIPWFLETGATPVFFDTHAYVDDTAEFADIPSFTSLTYEGYKQYLTLASQMLPASQAPRLAPVGVAFLTVWEENRNLWHKLFHNFDHKHASPYGTFLTGAVIHFTLFGEMPERQVMLPRDHDLASLWSRARVMQEADQPPNPFPTYEEAEYLYDVADRVARKRHLPKSLTLYENGEAA